MENLWPAFGNQSSHPKVETAFANAPVFVTPLKFTKRRERLNELPQSEIQQATTVHFEEMKVLLKILIRIYQKTAPMRIRNSCRFEPSCSEYMIMSVDKYGLKKGVINGINRLKRCKPPNGGIDNP